MRLAVYTDYSYRRSEGRLYGERAFVLFLGALARHFDRVVVPGRLATTPGPVHYELSPDIEFVALPHYESVTKPVSAGWAWLRSMSAFWRVLDDVDAVWLLGPHPLCILFWLLATLRGRRVALGVRQNTPVYVRARRPGQTFVHAVADALDGTYRLLARRCPTVVVGPELADLYAAAPSLLEISVTLVDSEDLTDPDDALGRSYEERLQVLSVGRLETEKNPLLLADVLAALAAEDPRWHLLVCGEGPMEAALAARLDELGVADRATLQGYVPLDGGLLELYRQSQMFLHVSWTEGVPQVLFEAFAGGAPVVATAVGGVPEVVDDPGTGRLVPPSDPHALADAVVDVLGHEDREGLAARAREKARLFSAEASADVVEEALWALRG